MYFYDGHASGLFARKEKLSSNRLVCEVCGLADEYIGQASSAVAARDLLWKWWYHGGKPYTWNQCMRFLRKTYGE